MNNIISLSGGKDSTAMLLMMVEKKIKVDHIVFFDTGWDFPGMIEHIGKLEKHIGKEIVRLKYKISFDEAIKKWGFPSFKRRWCTDRKVKTINQYCKKYKPFIQWIGFSYDERKRIKKTIGYCYPLIDWKMTEEDALNYCKELWLYFPEYWQRLSKMQTQSSYRFRLDYTLEELDERFRREESYHQLEL